MYLDNYPGKMSGLIHGSSFHAHMLLNHSSGQVIRIHAILFTRICIWTIIRTKCPEGYVELEYIVPEK